MGQKRDYNNRFGFAWRNGAYCRYKFSVQKFWLLKGLGVAVGYIPVFIIAAILFIFFCGGKIYLNTVLAIMFYAFFTGPSIFIVMALALYFYTAIAVEQIASRPAQKFARGGLILIFYLNLLGSDTSKTRRARLLRQECTQTYTTK